MSAVNSAFEGPRPGAAAGLWADKARLRRVLMFGSVGIFLAVAAAFYLTGGRYVSQEDSYVHANKLMVSTDVSGLVATVDVKEGQAVKTGDVLFTLDAKPFKIALENAQAALSQARQDAESTRAAYRAGDAYAYADADANRRRRLDDDRRHRPGRRRRHPALLRRSKRRRFPRRL